MRAAVRRVAVIGTGVIGASWAAWFLGQGLDVEAADPAPGAEDRLRAAVAAHWPAVQALAPAPAGWEARLRFHPGVQAAAAAADFVQENGPERLDPKRALLAALDAAAAPDVVIASSTSTLRTTDLQAGLRHPERVVLGHPFNPPHLIPLVEVVGGEATTPAAVDAAIAFYAACGKRPIRLRKEVFGHVANRLQAALWQEAFHLLDQGVASLADIDAAIADGPGLRWALLGPFMNLHLSGGAGGIEHMLAHLGPPTEAMWRALGQVRLSPELSAKVAAEVRAVLATRPEAAMVAGRDAALPELLAAKARHGLASDRPPHDVAP